MRTKTVEYIRRPRNGWLELNLGEMWAYRDLLATLMWRNFMVRYKQSVIGIAWAVIKPVLQMVIFSVVFGRLAELPSNDYPYPVFLYAGLLPWTYFSSTITSASGSLLAGGNMISKVYFPRMILPFSYLFAGLADLALSMVVLFGMMVWYRADLVLGPQVLLFPVFLIPAVVFSAGVSLWLCALAVRWRDIHHMVPYLVQIGLFVTPVVYAVNLVPERHQWILQLNPMTGVVEGFRWALLGRPVDGWGMMLCGFLLAGLILFSGMVYFRREERTLADTL